MKLWVDDIRPAPSGWILAKNYHEAIAKLSMYDYDEVSLDHDLGDFDDDGQENTGYHIALFLAQRKQDRDLLPESLKFLIFVPKIVRCHSMNPIGLEKINGVVERYLK